MAVSLLFGANSGLYNSDVYAEQSTFDNIATLFDNPFNKISDGLKDPFGKHRGSHADRFYKPEPQSKEEALRLSLLPLLQEKICASLNTKLDEINEQEKRYQQIQREIGFSANELFGMDVIGATTELKNQILQLMEISDCKKKTTSWFSGWWN